MSLRKHFVVIGLIVINGAMPVSASENELDHQSQNSISEREFRAEYASAVKKFKAAYQNIECRAECQFQFDDPNDLSRKKRYDYSAHLLMKDGAAVAVQDYGEETPRGGTDTNQVACATQRYAFDLHKTRQTNPYQVNYITRTPDRVERMRLILGDDVDVYLCAGSFMYHNPFEAILEKPSFTVVKLEIVPANTQESGDLVALDFQLTNDPWSISSGHVVFAPRLNWAVLEYHYRCDYSPTNHSIYTGKNTFRSIQKGTIPFPEKCKLKVIHYHADMQPISENHTANLTDFSLGTVDDSVFLLSHYGLPDTPLTASPSSIQTPIQWFLIGNGILLFLLLMGIVIKRTRTAQRQKVQS